MILLGVQIHVWRSRLEKVKVKSSNYNMEAKSMIELQYRPLALFRNYHFVPFRLRLALACARVPPAPFLLDALCLFHRPLEPRGIVYGFRYVPTPTDRVRT